MTNYKQPAAQADHTENHLEMAGRWYMVNKMGMATLCTDKDGAEKEAADAQRFWPHMGPHRAVQLVEAADVEALRARSVEPAGEYPALPVPVFESWAQGGLLREAGFTADQMRAYVDADRAMRAAQPAPENIRSILARCRDFIDTAKAPAYPAGADLADEIDALLAAQPAPQQKVQEPVAWMTQEGDRVATEKTMNAARRGGGAMLTSLHSYSVALVRAAAPQPSPAAQVDALEKLTFTVEESNG